MAIIAHATDLHILGEGKNVGERREGNAHYHSLGARREWNREKDGAEVTFARNNAGFAATKKYKITTFNITFIILTWIVFL